MRLAEKEAPGVKFTTCYRNQEKQYRVTGTTADGRTVSVVIDRDGKLTTVRTMTDVAPARVPRPVVEALQALARKKPELDGFKPIRTSLVVLFDAPRNTTANFYEFFGKNAKDMHALAQIDDGGEVRLVRDLMMHPDYYIRRKFLAPRSLPEPIQLGAEEVAPGVKWSRAYVQTNVKSDPVPDYVLSGKGPRGRIVEINVMPNGHAYIVREEVPLDEVPRPALEAVKRLGEREEAYKDFKPVEARRMRLLAFNGEVSYLLYGDDAEGFAKEIRVEATGDALVGEDNRLIGGGVSPATAPEEKPPSQGLGILAARFGRDARWVDVTDQVRREAPPGTREYLPRDLIDTAYGSPKGLVILFTDDGMVGLSTTKDGQKAMLPPPREDGRVAEVPADGFSVLVARYGSEDHWGDVTDLVRARVSKGRLESGIPEMNLPDTYPNVVKSLAIAYSSGGKVGLAIVPQGRTASLPPEGPPVNSSTLEARRVEYPGEVSSVSFTPDGRHLVAGIGDGTIRVIEVASGREVHRLEGHDRGGVAVAVAGNLVISGGVDSIVRLWDLKVGRERTKFRGHEAPITNIVFSANGKLAASGSWDRTARIWEVATGRELHAIKGHTEVVMGVAFTPDGRQLVTTSWDQSARLWGRRDRPRGPQDLGRQRADRRRGPLEGRPEGLLRGQGWPAEDLGARERPGSGRRPHLDAVRVVPRHVPRLAADRLHRRERRDGLGPEDQPDDPPARPPHRPDRRPGRLRRRQARGHRLAGPEPPDLEHARGRPVSHPEPGLRRSPGSRPWAWSRGAA